jgi:putative ABC transport system substrate-binding protein
MQFDQLKRREFLSFLGGAAAALPLRANAGQQKHVGALMNGVATIEPYHSRMEAFLQQLGKLGWIEGKNLHVDARWNEGNAELGRAYAGELVAQAPDIFLAASTANLIALQRLSPAAPIVFVQVSDPVTQGFVLNMAHPGGNITGFVSFEFAIGGKWLDLLRQMAPSMTHVAVMSNPQSAPQSKFFMRSVDAAAPTFGISTAFVPVQTVDAIEPAIANVAREPNGGLILPTDSFTNLHRKIIIEAAARSRLPAIYANEDNVRDGGLMYYVTEYIQQFRQAGVYIDRILRGTPPGDLPVQIPTKYTLGINLKTAKALGIEVPLSLLLIADEQIE